MLNHKITRSHSKPAHKAGLFSLPGILFLALTVLPLGLSAGVYKWVDEQGNVHYGSQRPENVESERMKVEASRTPYKQDSGEKDKDEKKAEAEAEAEKDKAAEQQAKPEEPEEPKLSRKQKKQLCEQSRKRLAMIESRGRLKATDDKGNVRALSDKERMARLKDARADVAEYCK